VWTRAFTEANLGRVMGLSLVVTLIIVVVQLLTSVLAAYAFAFLDFPLKKLMFVIVIGTLLLPIEVTLIANVETIRTLRLLNSVQGLTFPFLATAFGIFLIRQGFLGAWNQYVWPRFATDRSAWQTVQIALRTIGSDRVDRLNIGFAAAVLAALPLLLLLIFFQRQMIRGLTAGAVKG
jgi:sn-glycerol 3-phosphate transport system permease protein